MITETLVFAEIFGSHSAISFRLAQIFQDLLPGGRDIKDRQGVTLAFTQAAWSAFIASLGGWAPLGTFR